MRTTCKSTNSACIRPAVAERFKASTPAGRLSVGLKPMPFEGGSRAPRPDSPVEHYSDEYLNVWGEIFVKHELIRHLGMTFEQFIQEPHQALKSARLTKEAAYDR